MSRLPQATAAPQGPAPLAAPGAPAATPAPSPTPLAVTGDGVINRVPRTRAEQSALRDQRSELSDQLQSAVGRRQSLSRQLEKATGADRAGIEARIKLLDERILRLESDIASTGQLLTASLGQPLPGSPITNNMEDVFVPVVGMLSVFVFFPLAIAYARGIWRRAGAQKVESVLEQQNAERLGRLESAVDAIAVEVERISEGQRFVTRLLAETQQREGARIEAPRG